MQHCALVLALCLHLCVHVMSLYMDTQSEYGTFLYLESDKR